MEKSIEANEGTLFSPLFLRLLIPFGFAFFVSTFIGSITSMIAPHITADFGLSPAQLGGFISVNLAAFGLAQFPLGVMLDRYGGRNTLVAMLLLACAGTLLFAAAESYAALLAARALIGAGFAGALLSSFKSFSRFITCACTETSSAVVGSSAMSTAGRQASAMAIPTLWRIPPENS